MDPDEQLASEIANRRDDPEFQDRLKRRQTEDRPLLERLAAMKTIPPEQLAEALNSADSPFTYVRTMSGGRIEIITDRVTANSEPVTIYASTAVTGEWHVDDGGETYHRLADVGFDINAPGSLDIFHNALYRYRLHRVGSTVFARAPEEEPFQLLCRRFADALVALDGLRLLVDGAVDDGGNWGLMFDGREYGPFPSKDSAAAYGGTLADADLGPTHEWNAFPLIRP